MTNNRYVLELQRIGEAEKTVFTRASRSVPGSGEVWARFLRFLVCKDSPPPSTHSFVFVQESKEDDDDDDPMDGGESVSSEYGAIATITGFSDSAG